MNIDLVSLYQQVFGYTGVPMLRSVNTFIRVPKGKEDIDGIDEGVQYSDQMSMLGTPYFMPTKLDDLWLPNEPIITVSGQNTIVKTVLTGVKGTVKEQINSDDYQIKIQGLIINETGDDYPEEFVRKIRAIMEKRESVKIDNRMLTLFDIHQVAIESYSFPGVEGMQHAQAYEISCVSDWPLELILKEAK